MTTTVEPPVVEATEQQQEEVPAAKFWRVTDTYWLSERRIADDFVFEEMPREDHPTKSAYGRNRLYLYIGREDIARGMESGTSKSGRLYVYVSPDSATEHPGPSTEGARRQKILDQVAGLGIEELRQLYITEAMRYQQSYWALHRYADENGYCPTFDQIMESTGWPRRPKAYTVILSVKVLHEVNNDWLHQYVGRQFEFTDQITGQVWQEYTVRVSTPKISERPQADDSPVGSIWPNEEEVRRFFTNYHGEPKMTTADWSTVKIKEVR